MGNIFYTFICVERAGKIKPRKFYLVLEKNKANSKEFIPMGRPRQGAILAEKAINGLAGVEEGENCFDTKVVDSGEGLAV